MSTPRPPGVERDHPLARLTTVRTGGRGEFFARAGSEARLLELLAWARGAGLDVSVVGSGSNLLIADEGVRGLVLKLDRELAGIAIEGPRALCGGGARLPAIAARAARAGLSGIEFGVNIPGTLGGAVRMNANAYGGELGRVLEWVEIAGPDGVERRGPEELGLGYRSSNLPPGEVVARASLLLASRRPRGGVGDARGDAPDAPRGPAAGDQDLRLDLQEPRRPARGGSQRGRAALGGGTATGSAVGGARFAPKHANFIENTGTASTADVVAVMAEGRRRVLERAGVELEPEVQTLGDVRFPWR